MQCVPGADMLPHNSNLRKYAAFLSMGVSLCTVRMHVIHFSERRGENYSCNENLLPLLKEDSLCYSTA